MSKDIVLIGDIFAVRLPNGNYGAIKVADKLANSYLIITTPYLGTEVPSIENKLLGDILLQNRFFYSNKKAKIWVEGKKPKNMIYIGNIPLIGDKRKILCNSFGGEWDDLVGLEAFLEWRWKYDRENFEEEILEEERKNEELKKVKKSKKMMKDETFWSIISLLKINDEIDDGEMLEPAVNTLIKMSIKDIKEFEESLAYKLYLLDTKEHAKNIDDYPYNEGTQHFFSSDLFLYIRCSVIAKGKEYFELTLKKSENMSKVNPFEPLLSLASKAYTRKTGNAFEYIASYDYESFSNTEGWQ